MPRLNFTAWLEDVRGAYGRLLFRKQYGRMYVSRKGQPTAPPTADQLRHRELFGDGARYAQAVMADPVRRPRYVEVAKERNTNAFGLALGDFLNLPEVKEVDLTGYHGKVGDPVRVKATDDFELVSVTVTIRNEAGTVLEQGLAANIDGAYVYHATKVAPVDQTLTIEAAAKDLPGHERTLSEAWHA